MNNTLSKQQANQTDFRKNHLFQKPRHFIEFGIFTIGWWSCFFIYPLWYVPASDYDRWLNGGIHFLFFILVTYLFRSITKYSYVNTPEPEAIPFDKTFFGCLLPVAFLCHLPFLGQPVITGLDTIDHAVIPAVVAGEILHQIKSIFNFNLQPFLLFLFCLGGIYLLVAQELRAKLRKATQSFCHAIQTHYWKTLFGLFTFTALYMGVILYLAIPDKIGDISSIFRYPPISKIMLTPVYLVLGIHEYWGRLIQIAFNFAGAYYLYKLAYRLSGKDTGRIAALFFVLSPPMFYYAHSHMIDSGTLFFVAATFYYAITYIETKHSTALVRTCLLMTFGFLYKHPLVSAVPAFALMVAYDTFFPRRFQLRPALRPSILVCLIPTLTIYNFMRLSHYNPDTPDNIALWSWDRFIKNLAAIPQGMTLPIALLFLAGFVYLAIRSERRHFWLLTCWIGAHYLISCMSKVYYNVRQSLPYYIGLFVVTAIFLSQITPHKLKLRPILFYGILPVYLLTIALYYPFPMDYYAWGKALGDRSYINLSTWDDAYIPYGMIIQDLKTITDEGDIILAPMANESVQFYLYKHEMLDRQWIRQLWGEQNQQTLDGLKQYTNETQAEWLLLPRGRWLYRYVPEDLIEQMFDSPPNWAEHVKTYQYGETEVGLWKVR